MLIAAQRLVDGLRQPRTRADDLAALRQRRRQLMRGATVRERELAARLRELRVEVAERFGALSSCASCAKGCALPAGRWAGGHCCSSRTEELFTDDEVAALALGGTRNWHAPRGDQAGCAFRGPTGCSLTPVDRPNRCVAYLCRDATREVHGRHALDDFERAVAALSAAYVEFAAARAERELDAMLGA